MCRGHKLKDFADLKYDTCHTFRFIYIPSDILFLKKRKNYVYTYIFRESNLHIYTLIIWLLIETFFLWRWKRYKKYANIFILRRENKTFDEGYVSREHFFFFSYFRLFGSHEIKSKQPFEVVLFLHVRHHDVWGRLFSGIEKTTLCFRDLTG